MSQAKLGLTAEAVNETAAALERARVVQVLDGWCAEDQLQRDWASYPARSRTVRHCCVLRGVETTYFHGATPDEARAKAAQAIEAGEV